MRVNSTTIPRKRDNEIFKDGSGFVFEAYLSQGNHIRIDGPLCPKSLQLMPSSVNNTYPAQVKCINSICKQTHKMEKDHHSYREEAHRFYDAMKRSKLPFENWDVSKSEESDSTHKIKAYFTNVNGKPKAIILIFEKDNHTGDKSQVFLDLKNEQVTFDPTDIPLGKIISKITIEFRNSTNEIKYK